LKKEVLKEIFTKGISPPYGWGIDTFITLESLMYGYKMGEVYLGQKMHGKKTLTNLKKMFEQCFIEAVRMIQYFYSLPVRKKIQPIIMISSPFKKDCCFSDTYMNVEKEVTRSIPNFNLMKSMMIPHDDLFMKIKNIDDFRSFYEITKSVNVNVWVEMLYWFVKKYNPDLLNQYYLRWKIRALSFCLHEINTVEQAEDRTVFQAKTAADFIQRIGDRAIVDDKSKRFYFYKI